MKPIDPRYEKNGVQVNKQEAKTKNEKPASETVLKASLAERLPKLFELTGREVPEALEVAHPAR